MGRGRARAKQTKVARDLKYRTEKTDFEALQRELQEASRNRKHTDEDKYDDWSEEPPDND